MVFVTVALPVAKPEGPKSLLLPRGWPDKKQGLRHLLGT
jgi:hypothetical protein